MLAEVAPLHLRRDVFIPPTLRPEARRWITTVCVCASNEPMSMCPLAMRSNPGPRWSKKGGGVKFGSPVSIARLPGNNAWVKVEPPLFCNGPSSGSVLIWSPGPVRKPPPSSLLRLYPSEVTVPDLLRILPPDAPAFRILLPISTVPRFRMPPPLKAELLLMVLLVTRMVPLSLNMAPPTDWAELSLKVLLVIVSVALLTMPPPSLAMLPLIVVLAMVSSAASLKMPPPKPARLPLTVQLIMVAVGALLMKMPPPKLPWAFLIVRPEIATVGAVVPVPIW